MVANNTVAFRRKQSSVIKFMVAEKGKTYEIYRIIWNVHDEACFSENFIEIG